MTRTSKIDNRGRRVGYGLFRWAKWRKMTPLGRSLWMGLYASAEAATTPVGLWWGDRGQLARAAALTRAQVDDAIVELTDPEVDAIAYEELEDGVLVVRMTELPDRVEGAFSHTQVYGWWGRFCNVPTCSARDDHLPLLRWLCDASDDDAKRAKVLEAWDESFGRYAASAAGGGEGTGEGTGYPTGGGTSEGTEGVRGRALRGERGEERSGSSSSGSQISTHLPRDPDREIATSGPDPAAAEIATSLWAGVIARLSERVLAQHVDMWLSPITATALDGSVLQLRAPNTYVRTWFESQYRDAVLTDLRALTGCDLRVVVEVEHQRSDQERSEAAAAGVDDLAARARERYGPARAAAGRSGR